MSKFLYINLKFNGKMKVNIDTIDEEKIAKLSYMGLEVQNKLHQFYEKFSTSFNEIGRDSLADYGTSQGGVVEIKNE